MVDSVVDNWSMRTQRRAEIKLDFTDTTKAPDAQELLDTIKKLMLQKQPRVANFSVFLTDYSKAGITITLEYFTPSVPLQEFNTIKQEINMELMQLIEDKKMVLSAAVGNINIINPTDTVASKSSPIL